jgi:hypothetical protein
LEKIPEMEFILPNQNFGRSLDLQNVATRMDNVYVEKLVESKAAISINRKKT